MAGTSLKPNDDEGRPFPLQDDPTLPLEAVEVSQREGGETAQAETQKFTTW
jgi:hypothetical protein